MTINLNKIEEIYGKNYIYEFYDNKEEAINNINYLISLGFKDVSDIVENNPYMFLIDEKTFKEKVSNIIDKLGVEYIEKLEQDFTLWGEIDE